MQGKPNAETIEAQLKDHIKAVWAQWVKAQITRPQLLESVAMFVKKTCPEAANVDVIHEFKSWYEREFELQRQRHAPNSNSSNQTASAGVNQAASAGDPRGRRNQPVTKQFPTPASAAPNPTISSQQPAQQSQQPTQQPLPLQQPVVPPTGGSGVGRGQPVPVGRGQPTSVGMVQPQAVMPPYLNNTRVQPPIQGKPEMMAVGSGIPIQTPMNVSPTGKPKQEVIQQGKGKPEPSMVIPSTTNKAVSKQPGTGRGAGRGSGRGSGRGRGVGGRGRGQGRKSVAGKGPTRLPVRKNEAVPVAVPVGVPPVQPSGIGVPPPGTVPPANVVPTVPTQIPMQANVPHGVVQPPGFVQNMAAAKPVTPNKTQTQQPKQKGRKPGPKLSSPKAGEAIIGVGRGSPKPNPPLMVEPSPIPVTPSVVIVGEKRDYEASGVMSSPSAQQGKKLKLSPKLNKPMQPRSDAAPIAPPVSTPYKTPKPPPARPGGKGRPPNKPPAQAPAPAPHTGPMAGRVPNAPGVKPGVGYPGAPPGTTASAPSSQVPVPGGPTVNVNAGMKPGGMNVKTGNDTNSAAGNMNATNTGTGAPVKRKMGVEDELTALNGVVDVEREENMMVRGSSGADDVVVIDGEESYSDKNMLLAGAILRQKMQKVARRLLPDENIGVNVMELISLAVEERLRYVIDGLREAAATRIDAEKANWVMSEDGISVYDQLNRIRKEEEQNLFDAIEKRLKKQNEKKEANSRRPNDDGTAADKNGDNAAGGIAGTNGAGGGSAAGSGAGGGGSGVGASAGAGSGAGSGAAGISGVGSASGGVIDAEKAKEKIALDKKKRENSSQRDALSGLLEGRNRKRGQSSLKPLVQRKPGGPKGLWALSALPPLSKKNSSSGGAKSGENSLKASDTKGGLRPLGKEFAKEGYSSMKGSGGADDDDVILVMPPKEKLVLGDCINFFENEVQSRKSVFLYEWMTRYGIY